MKTLLRILLSPIVLLVLLGGAISHLIVWVFDPTYSHRLALNSFYTPLEFFPNLHDK